ncbi:MAG: hypothetical protein ABH875_05615 [Candidatus Omnitrophota bacterium]
MRDKSRFLIAILVSVSVFLIFLVIAIFNQQKNMELEFNERKAKLIKENLDLKDDKENLGTKITQKEEAIALLQEKRNAVESELKTFEDRVKGMRDEYEHQVLELKEENVSLTQRIEYLESMPLSSRIKEAIANEENQKLRTFLAKVISNIDIIEKGGDIELEPIVVTDKKEEEEELEQSAGQRGVRQESVVEILEKTGNIISVDEKYSLIVFDLGRKDGAERGAQCAIAKGDRKIAAAEIISSRYRVAAAFIYEMEYGYSIKDIKEGDSVIILE